MTREEREDAIVFFEEVAKKEVDNAKYSKLAIEALKQEPCEDCISRQAVLDIAKSSKSNWIDNSVLFKRVNELSPVTPQPKMGHWVELGYLENDNYDFECSVCHHTDTHSKTVKVNYCWNCGAKMEWEVEE